MLLFIVLMLSVSACQTSVQPERERLISPVGMYSYPFANPFAATVIGTPPEGRVTLPKGIPIRTKSLPLVDDRVVPEVFWYENRFRYSLATQRDSAPLVFVVAGTNGGHANRLSRFLQQVLFIAGYHVASISSPTFPNFMVTASATSVPGRTSQDAYDLYRTMQRVRRDVEEDVPVESVSLVGYSLGGWQSAFVAELDSRERAIGFDKVLLINPPVSLYRSSRVLDNMLIDNLPGGIDGLDAFINRVLARLTAVYRRAEAVEFGQDLLYQAYIALRPTDDQLAALIGAAFRLSSANISFTADVMSHFGYLVSADRRLRISTSLTPYFDAAMRRGFIEYFEEFLYPYYRARNPDLTQQQFIEEASLEYIQPFLARAENIGMVTNEDDIILAPGDLDFLKATFAGRAEIFPNGGHCGNMQDPHVVAAVVRFLGS
jgi:pimeloyl-ACP methyl ester carboxylesterase